MGDGDSALVHRHGNVDTRMGVVISIARGITEMNREYYRAIAAVLFNGVESAPRRKKVLELLHPYALKLACIPSEIGVSNLKPFHTRIDYAEAELQWYLSGSARIDELIGPSGKSYAHLWKRFSDNGIHANSAYGQYIFGETEPAMTDDKALWQNMSQWEWVRYKLRYDPDTRQAVININQPRHKVMPTKDFPCCIVMMFTVRDGKLNLVTVFRSQDVDTGLRNDVYTMYRLQIKMAQELGMPCGTFTNVALNLHLYESKWDAAIRVTKDWKERYEQNESR